MERDVLAKEKFLEGNRQRWAVIFLLCGGAVLTVNLFVPNFDPVPYMQFLLAIGSLFILGASGDSWVKAYKVSSIKQTEIQEETKRMVSESSDTPQQAVPDRRVVQEFYNKNSADPSYAPIEWVQSQDTGEEFKS